MYYYLRPIFSYHNYLRLKQIGQNAGVRLGSCALAGKKGSDFMRPLDFLIRDNTMKYLEGIDMANIPKPETVSEQLLDLFRVQCACENAVRDKADKVCAPTSLPAAVLAEVMMKINHVKLVSLSPNKHRDSFILVAYNEDGENAGLYTEDRVFQIAKSYDYMLNNKKFKEVCLHLQQELPLTILSSRSWYTNASGAISSATLQSRTRKRSFNKYE